MPSGRTSLQVIGVLLLMMAALWAPPCAGTNFQEYVERYSELFDAGNYDAALAEARRFEAAARAQHGNQHESYAGAL